MKRTINRFVFQKNFCKISSKDSSRYFAIIIPSVLSVFEEIKNLRNIFYNVVFFSNCKILLQHHIIKTKMKQRIWGLKKRYLTYVNIIHTLHFQLSLRYLRKKLIKSYFCFLCNYLLFFFTENSVKSTSTTKESTSSSNYLRNHHQPDLVKVSQSPKVVTSNAELARLEHILDEKNRENERLRARLGHNAKGFEALAVTVNHLAKKVNWIFNYISFSEGCNIISKISYHIFHLFAARILPSLLSANS